MFWILISLISFSLIFVKTDTKQVHISFLEVGLNEQALQTLENTWRDHFSDHTDNF